MPIRTLKNTKNIICSHLKGHGKEDIVQNVAVPAGQSTDVVIGMYEQPMPQPELCLEMDTMADQSLTSSLQRIDGKGEYTLVYHLKNNSTETCNIAVHERFSF